MKHPTELSLMEEAPGNIVLFRPHISERAREMVHAQLGTRWVGQGPSVDRFEEQFAQRFCAGRSAAAVGSGTDALHLAYLLAGVGPGDEVVTPLFTCTATNIPLLYIGAKPVFADIQAGTMNIDVDHVRRLVSKRTKAIVCVHYGGLPCDMDELLAIGDQYGIPVIEDAAHAVGASYRGRSIGAISPFTMFSFQAIKHITTGDGGMLVLEDSTLLPKLRRLRWFGIDREGKQRGIWDNDICDIGFKYQMTDIAAALGLAALEEWDEVFRHRRKLFEIYEGELSDVPGLEFVGGGLTDRVHAAWLCTVFAERRVDLQVKLREHHIESNQVHYRNDRYSIFKEFRASFPNMDAVEDKYLVLPLHTHMTMEDAQRVVKVIQSGW